jgi:hypothetical protein
MESKTEKNIHGIDCVIESYHENGKIRYRFEWDASRTETRVVESYHENGKMQHRCEWDAYRVKTHIMDAYYYDGAPSARSEWNHDRTDTRMIEAYYNNGQLSYRYEWNHDRTDTILVIGPGTYKYIPTPLYAKENSRNLNMKLVETMVKMYKNREIPARKLIELLDNM